MPFAVIILTAMLQSPAALKPFLIGKGFTVTFPSQPHLTDPSAKPPEDSWTAKFRHADFVATVEPRPDTPLLTDLSLAHTIAASFGETLMAKTTLGKDVVRAGWIGVSFTSTAKELKEEGRIYLAGKYLVTLTVMGSSTIPADAAKAFLDSFNPPANLHGSHKIEEVTASENPTSIDIGSGYQVTFPAAPKSVTDPSEKTIKIWIATKDRSAYLAELTDDPVTDTDSDDQAITAMKYGQADGAHGKTSHQKDILLQGWPGLAFEGSSIEGKFSCRSYRINRHFLTLLSRYIADSPPLAVGAFFDSLKLPSNLAAGPYQIPGPEFKPYAYEEAAISVEFPNPPDRTIPTLNANVSAPQVRYEAVYGDRDFGFTYSTFPPEILAKLNSVELDRMFDAAIKNTLRDMKLSEVRRSDSVTDGVKTVSAEGTGDTGFKGRVDVFYRSPRFYIFVAEVPKSLVPSDEVTRFFKSIKWLVESK